MWFVPGTILLGSRAPDKNKLDQCRVSKYCFLIKFLPSTLSMTKNKSTDQIWIQLNIIFMEKVLYTNFWKRMPVVFPLDQYLASANHQKIEWLTPKISSFTENEFLTLFLKIWCHSCTPLHTPSANIWDFLFATVQNFPTWISNLVLHFFGNAFVHILLKNCSCLFQLKSHNNWDKFMKRTSKLMFL